MMKKKDKVYGKQFLWYIATEMKLWREGGGGDRRECCVQLYAYKL